MRVAFLVDNFPLTTKSFSNYRFLALAEKGVEVSIFFRTQKDLKLLADYPFDEFKHYKAQYERLSSSGLLGGMVGLALEMLDKNKRRNALNYWNKSKNSKASIRQRLKTLLTFKKILYWQPEILHVDESYLGVYLAAELLALDLPVVISLRGADIDHKIALNPRWAKWLTLMREEKNIFFHCVSNYILNKSKSLGIPTDRTKMIYAGFKEELREKFDLARREPMHGRNIIRLLTVCRLSPEKGVAIALEAVQLLHLRNFTVKYEIIGDGPQMEELKHLAMKLNIHNQVEFHGEKHNLEVLKYLKSSSLEAIYVQPSLREAFGFSLLEAANAQLPIIAANVGGMPELIEHKFNGLLFEKGNAKDLAEKIEYLAERTEKQNLFATRTTNKMAAQFDSSFEADSFIHWFSTIIEKKKLTTKKES